MRIKPLTGSIVAFCFLLACSDTTDDRENVADAAGVAPTAAPPVKAGPAQAFPPSTLSPQARAGERSFLLCQSCHTLNDGGPHMVGPNLHGLAGATAGSKEGYNFSPALTESGIIWSEETLEEWIESPSTLVPGNKMAFAGLRDEEKRAALIRYLLETTE